MRDLCDLLELNDFNFPFLSYRVTAHDYETPLKFHYKHSVSVFYIASINGLTCNVVEILLPISNLNFQFGKVIILFYKLQVGSCLTRFFPFQAKIMFMSKRHFSFNFALLFATSVENV